MVLNGNVVLDKDQLAEVCLRAYARFDEVSCNLKTFLPQWNLPVDLEKRLRSNGDSRDVANYLFTLASMERRQVSRINIRNGKRTWRDLSARWIFDPVEVVERNISTVADICENSLGYKLRGFPTNYFSNAEELTFRYNGDAGNVVRGRSVDKVREELMKFKGIGTGISNLFIIYLSDRGIASPIDCENSRVKVDIHKARIPLNSNCIRVSENVRRDALIGPLEEGYLDVCRKYGLDARQLDSALWTVGSELCARNDYRVCHSECPLEELCVSNVFEDQKTGLMLVYDKCGKRVDSRKNSKQMLLF